MQEKNCAFCESSPLLLQVCLSVPLCLGFVSRFLAPLLPKQRGSACAVMPDFASRSGVSGLLPWARELLGGIMNFSLSIWRQCLDWCRAGVTLGEVGELPGTSPVPAGLPSHRGFFLARAVGRAQPIPSESPRAGKELGRFGRVAGRAGDALPAPCLLQHPEPLVPSMGWAAEAFLLDVVFFPPPLETQPLAVVQAQLK